MEIEKKSLQQIIAHRLEKLKLIRQAGHNPFPYNFDKTDSAVRITHIESGIVVQCQNERSQLKNKNIAMKMLRARLYQNKMEERTASQEPLSGEKKEIAWGSQIRSYVFHPYNMVKDHRTKCESSNIQSVMDGNIDPFIRAYLLSKLEK